MSNQFTWTDETVKQFARVYAAGTRGKYKKAKKIDDKLSIFKQVGPAVSSKTPKRGRPSTTLLVDKGLFLDWYFDNDTCESFVSDHNVVLKLFTNGRFWVRIDDIINNCGYIPTEVVHDSMRKNVKLDENDEVDLSYYTTFKFVTP
jgi:translation initiation factor IF-1